MKDNLRKATARIFIFSFLLASCSTTKMAVLREDYLMFKVKAAETAHSTVIKNATCVAVPASVLMLTAM